MDITAVNARWNSLRDQYNYYQEGIRGFHEYPLWDDYITALAKSEKLEKEIDWMYDNLKSEGYKLDPDTQTWSI